MKFENPLTPQRLETLTRLRAASWRATKTVAKYGTVFGSGVCIGTLCGVALFFYISEK